MDRKEYQKKYYIKRKLHKDELDEEYIESIKSFKKNKQKLKEAVARLEDWYEE